MYIFDLLCTSLSLASILFYAHRRWVLSFIAFWLAWKSKELAVMLPAVLVAYEYWFGERKFRRLIPFLLVALSFGVQGVVLNPNRDNPYTFHFTPSALRHTIPFYAKRFLLFPLSGLALSALALVRDRRVWFGLAALSLLMVPLIFLPGRLFEAYTYLPLAFAVVALAAAASHAHPAWAWIALASWMPFNLHALRGKAGPSWKPTITPTPMSRLSLRGFRKIPLSIPLSLRVRRPVFTIGAWQRRGTYSTIGSICLFSSSAGRRPGRFWQPGPSPTDRGTRNDCTSRSAFARRNDASLLQKVDF